MSTTLQIGSATGVAVLSIVFFALAGQPAPAELGSTYAGALAGTLPISVLLALVAVVLVRVLPTVHTETASALIERVPSWAAGLAYSTYLATGGRLGEQVFDEILGETIERRTRRTLDAPAALGDFLTFHFQRTAEALRSDPFEVKCRFSIGSDVLGAKEDASKLHRSTRELNRSCTPSDRGLPRRTLEAQRPHIAATAPPCDSRPRPRQAVHLRSSASEWQRTPHALREYPPAVADVHDRIERRDDDHHLQDDHQRLHPRTHVH